MAALQNLIPDPTTSKLFQCRPASLELTAFPTFTSPTFVSISEVIGDNVYGMIATARNPGFDEPFAYSLITNNFLPVTNVLATNVPASPPTAGAWTPPQMALVGGKLVVTHTGFSGAFGNFFGYFDLTDPLNPVWNAGNCVGAGFAGFTVAPSGVAQFNGRAYFLHNLVAQPAVIFSDILSPTTNSASAANPVITLDDNVLLTAIAGLPLSSPITGGIIQSLMVFKVEGIWQITGDAALGTLAKNALQVPVGTLAPRSVIPTTKGLAFVAPDGLRIIDFSGVVSDPVGQDGQGIVQPFQYANVPSRVASAANASTLRISTQNSFIPGNPNQEWWYDFTRQMWTGPHTFPASSISAYRNTFIMAPVTVTSSLWKSDYVQSNTSNFTENGIQLRWISATSLLPDTDEMVQCHMTESTIDVAQALSVGAIQVTALQEDGLVLDAPMLPVLAGTVPLWGSVNWGSFLWGGNQAALSPVQIPWTVPIDFARLQVIFNGLSASGFKIGALHMRYQVTHTYIDQSAVRAVPQVAGRAFSSGFGPGFS